MIHYGPYPFGWNIWIFSIHKLDCDSSFDKSRYLKRYVFIRLRKTFIDLTTLSEKMLDPKRLQYFLLSLHLNFELAFFEPFLLQWFLSLGIFKLLECISVLYVDLLHINLGPLIKVLGYELDKIERRLCILLFNCVNKVPYCRVGFLR